MYETNELFVLNENNLFIGGTGGLLKTQNGGDTWEKIEITLPDQSYSQARAIWFIDQLHGWIGLEHEGGHGSLHKTTDSGYTWTIQVDSIHRVSDIYFNTYSFGWFVSGNKIFKTSDGGINWSIQAELQEIEPIALQFTSDNLGWIGGYIGLLKTEDAGNSWNEVFPLGMDLNIKDIHFINSLEGWVITDGGFNGPGIYKTTDGGISWINQSITNTVNIRYNDMFFFDNNKGWIVGNDELSKGLVLHTSDGGINWNAIHSPSSLYLTKVSFINENDGWILGENGTVLHTTNGGVTFIEDEENNFTQPKEFLLQQNFPNPFNPVTIINYQIPVVGLVTLKVYDLLGREVATLVNEEKTTGSYNVELGMLNLPTGQAGLELSSGIYFYKLQAGDFVETKKMILLK